MTSAVACIPSRDAPDPHTPFLFASAQETLIARGLKHVLAPAAADLAAGRMPRSSDPAGLLVGALPFDRARRVHLFQSGDFETAAAPDAAAPRRTGVRPWQVRSEPDREGYQDIVRRALGIIGDEASRDGGLRKVVLARSLLLKAPHAIDIAAVLDGLAADRSVTRFAVPLPDGAALVGASPELLVEKRGAIIRSRPLAGSERRHADTVRDRAAADSLLASDKNRREHALVVEAILDTLAPYCRQLSAGENLELTSTASMWHLATAIEGTLSDPDVPSGMLAALLHPTPAVCGMPQARAREVIAGLEPFDRGFFAGAVGWQDARGDGRWMVTIRCAEIAGDTARLYAGCGIVAGSDPATEAAETSGKFRALLQALGVDEDGMPLAGNRP